MEIKCMCLKLLVRGRKNILWTLVWIKTRRKKDYNMLERNMKQ